MIISGYTASELAATIARIDGGEPITRQRVSAIAKAEGWQAQRIGTMAIYPESEVGEYLAARRRTHLLNRAGWNPDSRKLYRSDDIDSECPICGAFAITRPLWQAQSGDEYLSDSWPWLCEQGHTNLLPGDALKAGKGHKEMNMKSIRNPKDIENLAHNLRKIYNGPLWIDVVEDDGRFPAAEENMVEVATFFAFVETTTRKKYRIICIPFNGWWENNVPRGGGAHLVIYSEELKKAYAPFSNLRVGLLKTGDDWERP